VRNFAGLADTELWALAADQQNGAAFGEIFQRHSAAVYAHCFRRTGQWTVAEDLTSVVFLEAWRRRREVRFAAGSVLPWLLAVANNAASNSQRAMRRHEGLLARLPAPDPEPDPADDAARRVDQERAIEPLLAALASLRRAERDVLTLCDWSGLSYAEAATALGIPIGTVRSRLARARRQMRQAVSAGPDTGHGCPDIAAVRSPMTTIWEQT
jgi:RNA polymerase sigma factor (sigma-70 family)